MQNQIRGWKRPWPSLTSFEKMEFSCSNLRIGIGYDAHPFAMERALILGGITIPFERGLLGHSDADVLIHAIIDALLGAAGLGDIGQHFPASDQKYKDISSIKLLLETKEKISERGFVVVNLDATIVAQRPKLSSFLADMKLNVAKALDLEPDRINIKAKCPEGLGFCGREEGIEAFCVALLMSR